MDIHINNEKGEVMYTKVTPEILKYDTPVICLGGLSQSSGTYEQEIKDLVMSGREVIFSNPIKGFEVSEDSEYEEFKEKYQIPDVIMSKMAAVEMIIKDENIHEFELDGHSQGGLIATLVAAKNPGLAKNLIIKCPGGLTGEQGFTEQLIPFSGQLYDNLMRKLRLKRQAGGVLSSSEVAEYQNKPGLEAMRERSAPEVLSGMDTAAKSFVEEVKRSEAKDSWASTFWWRPTKEIPGISKVELGQVLKDIQLHNEKNPDKATQVTLLIAHGDKLFPEETYKEIVKIIGEDEDLMNVVGPELGEYVNAFANYLEPDASHTAPGIEPAGISRQILNG